MKEDVKLVSVRGDAEDRVIWGHLGTIILKEQRKILISLEVQSWLHQGMFRDPVGFSVPTLRRRPFLKVLLN